MRVLLFGDDFGIARLMRHLPRDYVCGVVAAGNRPRYHDAVRISAYDRGLPFAIQPAYHSAAYDEFVAWVKERQPDLILVSSYSMILRPDVLGVPPLGGINVHGALLPKYRGSNPLQWAIINGENVTGVTLHEMSAGIDEGAIIDRRVVPLYFEDAWQMAQRRVTAATENLLADNLPQILSGCWHAVPQDPRLASSYRRRTADDGLFNWDQPVRRIYNLIRALVAPHPGAHVLDAVGNRQVFDRYLTPADITAFKYGEGGQRLGHSEIELRPPVAQDGSLLRQWLDLQLEASWCPEYCRGLLTCPTAEIAGILAGRSDIVLFILEDAISASPIGTGQIFNINWRHGSAELRLDFTSANGFATVAARMALSVLVAFGRRELALHRLYAVDADTNFHALRLYEECGLLRKSVLRKAGCNSGGYVDGCCLASRGPAND